MSILDNLQNNGQELLNKAASTIVNNGSGQGQNNVASSGNGNTNTQLSEVEAGRDINIYTTEIIPQEEEVFKDPTETFTLQENVTPIYR